MPVTFTSSDQPSTWLEPDQVEALRTACYDDCFQSTYWQRNETIITVLYDTGLGVSELVELDTDHVELDAGTIQVPDSRTSEPRTSASSSSATLDLDPEHTLGTGRLLASYLQYRKDSSAVLFPSRNGGRLTPKAIRDVVTKAAESAEIRPYMPSGRGDPGEISPQTLRHSTAWRLLTVENRSLSEVRDRLRHTALSTTRSLYAPFTGDRDRDRDTEIHSPDPASRKTLPNRETLVGMLNAVPDILFSFDTDGRMLWWNTRVPEVTGYGDAEIADMHPLDFVAPSDRTQIAEALARMATQGTIELEETHLVTKDDESLPYEITGAPLTDDDGDVWGVTGVGRDVSTRKRFERISDGFYTLDTDWRFTSLNSRAEALFGRSEDALLGTVIWEAFPEEAEMQIYEEFHAAMDTQESVSFDLYYPSLDTWFDIGAYPSETGLSVYLRDITARKERERQLEQFRTLTEAATDVLVTINDESTIQTVNPAVTDVFGYEPDELIGEPLTTLMSGDLAAQHRAALQQYLETGERTIDWSNVEVAGIRADGSEVPLAISFNEAEYGGQQFFTGIVRDITDRKERERALERQRTELAQLNQFNELVEDLFHAVLAESTRAEIEQTVCDQLATSEFYHAAWIGDRSETTATITPRVSAGIELDAVPTAEPGTLDGASPSQFTARAADTRDACVSHQPLDERHVDADHDQSWAADTESALAVPITYGDVLYGVLVVYTTQETGFGDRQQASFVDLGDTIGFAIAAAERKEALVAERVFELTLSIRDPDQFFIRAANRFDATVTLDGLAVRGDDEYLAYFSVTGASPAAIRDLGAQPKMPDHVHVVNATETSVLCEVGVTDSSPITAVADYGGTVTDMTVENDGGTVRIELPRTADVSRVLDALRATGAEVELRAKRTVERPMQTDNRFQTAVADQLTDKQRHALESAYRAGFFEQPRDSTGEEIAASMDISPSTFHQHLRVGLEKLVSLVIDTP